MAQSPGITVPQELIGEIAHHFSADMGTKEDTLTLRSCSLVCKSFRSEFQPHLFSHISIYDPFPTEPESNIKSLIPKLSQLLQLNSGIAIYIRKLEITFCEDNDPNGDPWVCENPELPGILEKLNWLDHFSFGVLGPEILGWNSIGQGLQTAISSVCMLPTIISLRFASMSQLPPSLFVHAQGLKSLKLRNVLDLNLSTDAKLSSTVNSFGRITEFDCGDSISGIMPFVMRCRPFFSRLRTLRVESQPRDTGDIQKLVTLAGGFLKSFFSISFYLEPLTGERIVTGPYDLSTSTSLTSLTFIVQNINNDYPQFITTVYDTLNTLDKPKLEELTLEVRPLAYDLENLFVGPEEEWTRLDAILNRTHFPLMRKVFLLLLPPTNLDEASYQHAVALKEGDACRDALASLSNSNDIVFETRVELRVNSAR